MTNQAFYAFCRDQRKMEPDPHKREALAEVYNYMRECVERLEEWVFKEKERRYRWIVGDEWSVRFDPVA